MKLVQFTDDELSIITTATQAALDSARKKLAQTEELLRTSNLLGYAEMAKAYAKLVITARNEVAEHEQALELLTCAQLQEGIEA